MVDYSKMSKAALLKKYGSWYKSNYGAEEYTFLRNQDTRGVRDIISHIDPEPVKKYAGGLMSNKKYMNPVKVIDNRKKKNK